jgi:hypothetical protein
MTTQMTMHVRRSHLQGDTQVPDKRKNKTKRSKGATLRPAAPPSKPLLNPLQMRQMAAIDASQLKPCLLCGQLTHSGGVFVPEDPQVLGMGNPEEGRTRTVMYPLCERCQELSGAAEQAEAKILAEINRGEVPPPEKASEWIRRRSN